MTKLCLIQRVLLISIFLLSRFCLAEEEPTKTEGSTKPVPEGWVKYVSQPNGWGKTREAAVKDLHERIFPMYTRIWGDRPGFTISQRYALVEISDGRMWQADGTLWWYVPPAKTKKKRVSVGIDRGLRSK
ncbi:MAG: hypothetical protein AAFY98_01210 [Verrucomicrobiota bacterium]